MNNDQKNISIQHYWPWWRRIYTGLNILALILSIILSWHYLKGGMMIGCGAGSPCDQVLNSPWSVFAGIFPISGLAVGVYMALLISSFFIGPSTEEPIRNMAWKLMLIITGAIAGSAIWFTILQKWFIGVFCPYCMSIHITGLLMASLLIWRALNESGDSKLSRLKVAGLALTGLGFAIIMAVSQIIFTPPATYHKGESQNYQPELDYKTSPIIGSPSASYVVTLLFDYQCPHCQKLHFMLDDAVRRYNGKLAFVLCPSPLNTECNHYVPMDVDVFKNSCDLARIGLAVWLASRDAFVEFEKWMFTFESGNAWQPRSLEATKAKAVELIGQTKFDTALNDPWIGQYIQKSVQIYGQTMQSGRGGIPKMIFGPLWVIPQPNTSEDLIMILQNSLALPKP